MRLALAALLIGCSGGSGGNTVGSDDCPAFTRIVDGNFSRSGTTLTWTLEVEEMPAELTFDRETTPSFILEYSWAVELDTDADGVADLEVAANHFKRDTPPVTTAAADMFSVVQVALWAVTETTGTITGSADAAVTGNTITFTVDESEDAGLAEVTETATYTTFHQAGPSILTDQCADRLAK